MRQGWISTILFVNNFNLCPPESLVPDAPGCVNPKTSRACGRTFPTVPKLAQAEDCVNASLAVSSKRYKGQPLHRGG